MIQIGAFMKESELNVAKDITSENRIKPRSEEKMLVQKELSQHIWLSLFGFYICQEHIEYNNTNEYVNGIN